uniref:Uncharacterized protein n=1 Tax=Amphimedon queenslandica TaxID=400682 RepID=A0A1X7T7U7_AMPQE
MEVRAKGVISAALSSTLSRSSPILPPSLSQSSIKAGPVLSPRPIKRFLPPTSEDYLRKVQENAIPQSTAKSTSWTLNIWKEWADNRKTLGHDFPGAPHLLQMHELNNWMSKFIVEIRRKDGKEYPASTLYQICCGIMRHLRQFYPSLNFFTMPEFDSTKKTLDGEMKRIKAATTYIKKQAEPITMNEEKWLWEKGMLGEGSPHKLLETMIFMCGIYFALRSGQEHRDLRFSQIKLKEIDGKKCLIYTENVSKNNSG